MDYFEQALSIRREAKASSGEAISLNIVSLQNDMGQSQKALENLNQSLEILKGLNNDEKAGTALNLFGAIYDRLGEYQKALDYYNQSLDIQQKVGDRNGEANTLNNRGSLYDTIGQTKRGSKDLNSALKIYQEVGDRNGEATALNNISFIYMGEKNFPQALKNLSKALLIHQQVGDTSGEIVALHNIGYLYDKMGNSPKALKILNDALSKAIKMDFLVEKANILSSIGMVYGKLKNPQKALENLNEALLIQKQTGDHYSEAITLKNLGDVYQDLDEPTKAIEVWEKSVNIGLEMRKGFQKEHRRAFMESDIPKFTAIALIDLLINQKQAQEAFTWTNLVTTFDLADYNRLIDAKVTNPEAQKALDDLTIKDREINALREQIKDKYSEPIVQQIRTLEAEANRQKEKIINIYPEVSELLETKPADIAQLQKSIPANTVVIQPALLIGMKKRLDTVALFVVTSTQLQVIQTPLPKDFNQLLETYRQQLEKGSNYLTISGQLYDILIRPLEQKNLIPANSDIAIISTGKLREIPFESLYDNQNKQYLLEKYPIHYLTRLSKAQNIQPGTEQSPNILKPSKALAIANPLPSKQELKNTESEADYLTATFPNSESYKNQQATLETFKLRAINFSILHLGTHGCFQPEGCQTLGMAPNTLLFANNEQYPIKDAALLGLKNTELLVIGACQTAKITKDDDVGLTGLAYIWERAGAKSVVASLWSAPDQESAELMKQFYGNLKQGMGKAESLRQAKLTILRETPDGKHPFFWSPFVLIGDGGKMGQ
jgi:CHAT domain-containing protein/Flp pilus assembly protein TadD